MKLIADSGSTKTDWCLTERGEVRTRVQTQGINPFHQDDAAIRRILTDELLTQLSGEIVENVTEVYFYGAGCFADKADLLKSILESMLKTQTRHALKVEVYEDMMGAARGLCGHESGIAAILGTGANSCYYDGEQIVDYVPALGYILGDEGSGAVLGKLFMNAIFKGDLSEEIRDLYLRETSQTYPEIIDRVYRQPLANRYLASVSTFIGAHKEEYPELSRLVIDNFRDFFRKNVEKYGRPELKVGVIGSIAFHYRDELMAAAAIEGFQMGLIMKSPMEGLIAYHA